MTQQLIERQSHQSVQDFIRRDRWWKREHRITHAKYQLNVAKSPANRVFWELVLEALTGE